ncbi:hypothetical protein DPEC_G00282490, partial [Dallia pectoralis]
MDVPPRDLGKMAHRCPICNLKYANLVQHLKLGEQVCNRTELDLLCKMAHTHFTAPLDCPVHSCESIQLTRLDKHLSRVHNLQSEMVTLYMQTAKDRYIARELALLRASRPHPPMVSHIDEVNDAAVEEGIRREIEGHSSQPSALSAAEPSDPSAAEPSALSAAEPS